MSTFSGCEHGGAAVPCGGSALQRRRRRRRRLRGEARAHLTPLHKRAQLHRARHSSFRSQWHHASPRPTDSGGGGRTAVAAANTGRAEMVAVARISGDSGGGATGNERAVHVRHRWFVTAAVEQGLSRAACARRADPRAPADRAPLVGAPRPPAAGAGSGARVRRTRVDERGVTKEARRANADRGLTESARRADPRVPA